MSRALFDKQIVIVDYRFAAVAAEHGGCLLVGEAGTSDAYFGAVSAVDVHYVAFFPFALYGGDSDGEQADGFVAAQGFGGFGVDVYAAFGEAGAVGKPPLDVADRLFARLELGVGACARGLKSPM